jgi:hypothetical protein
MEFKGNDILLFVLILVVPFYLYFNKDGSFLDRLKLYFGIMDINKTDLYNRNNDMAISSVNYKNVGGKPVVNIVRDKGPVTGENTMYYKPQYIPKDTLSGNDVGTTEYRFAQFEPNKPSKAWVDYNISQYPGFYKSDFSSNIYDLKQFFDKENVFRELPDNRKYYDMKRPDCPSCYTDVNGTNVCNFNNKLEKVPISLYNVGPHGKTSLQNVVSEEMNVVNGDSYIAYNYENDKAMNGSHFYGDVKGVIYGNDSQLRSSYYDKNDVQTCL